MLSTQNLCRVRESHCRHHVTWALLRVHGHVCANQHVIHRLSSTSSREAGTHEHTSSTRSGSNPSTYNSIDDDTCGQGRVHPQQERRKHQTQGYGDGQRGKGSSRGVGMRGAHDTYSRGNHLNSRPTRANSSPDGHRHRPSRHSEDLNEPSDGWGDGHTSHASHGRGYTGRDRVSSSGRSATASHKAATNKNKGTSKYRFYATCHPGLEAVVAGELRALGMEGVEEGKAGVHFHGQSLAAGYKANLWLRAAIRVLVVLAEADLDLSGTRRHMRGAEVLYDAVRDCGVWWDEVIPHRHTFSVEARVWSCTDITSSQLVRQRVKDAVCDAIKDARRDKPDPPAPKTVADVPLFVSAYQDHMTIYRDMSGTSLHRRGYRDAMHKSPLNEAAAAGVLMLAGWHKLVEGGAEAVLADPMCGSCTLLLEAHLMAHNTAPGLLRHERDWPCLSWPDVDQQAWTRVWQEAKGLGRPQWKGLLLGNDSHEGALSLAERDVKRMGAADTVRLSHKDAAVWVPPQVPDLVVTNPPWGLRIAGTQAGSDGSWERSHDTEPTSLGGLEETWRALSVFLRAQCPDRDAYVISGNKDAFHWLHMKTSAKWQLGLGGVDARLQKYHILPPRPASSTDRKGYFDNPLAE